MYIVIPSDKKKYINYLGNIVLEHEIPVEYKVVRFAVFVFWLIDWLVDPSVLRCGVNISQVKYIFCYFLIFFPCKSKPLIYRSTFYHKKGFTIIFVAASLRCAGCPPPSLGKNVWSTNLHDFVNLSLLILMTSHCRTIYSLNFTISFVLRFFACPLHYIIQMARIVFSSFCLFVTGCRGNDSFLDIKTSLLIKMGLLRCVCSFLWLRFLEIF